MINLSMAEPDNILRPRISVVGVGGAGGNAINNMIRSQLEGCDFIVANTDSQAMAMSLAPRKLQLGVNLSRGLGAGSKPDIGRAAAEEQIADIMALLEGSDMLFVTAGMGGGTGTGAAPVIARAARESGILTVGVVTKPFHFEGSQRMRQAEAGIAELQQYVDTLIVIPNQNLFRIANERTTFAEAFRLADEVLNSGVRGITDLMVMPGFMNLDFADVKTVMGEMGKAMMGTGEAEGDNRAIRAAEAAISNPLLDDISMNGARGMLINITGGLDMTLFEVDQAANRIREEVDPEAQIKVGSTLGEDLEGKIRVSVIATGIDTAVAEQQRQRAASGTGAVRGAVDNTRRVVAAGKPVLATPNINVTTSYFTMPTAVTPQMVAQHQSPAAQMAQAASYAQAPAQQQTQPTVATAENETSAQPPVVTMTVQRQTEAPVQQVIHRAATPQMPQSPLRQPVQQQQQRVQAAAQPVPAQQAPRNEAPAGNDMRVTQLTTALNASGQASAHVNQRSQSLFQRITGFGMVRPSAQGSDDGFEAEPVTEAAQPRLGIDSSDRPALSEEPSDLLDIPAFLRRQTNH